LPKLGVFAKPFSFKTLFSGQDVIDLYFIQQEQKLLNLSHENKNIAV
jgi:hypothetical protein